MYLRPSSLRLMIRPARPVLLLSTMVALLFGAGAASVAVPALGQRIVVPLDGAWSVEEGVAPDAIPASFSHTVAVPGLTNQARPAFADVDHYETHEYVFTMKRYGVLPPSEKCEGLGRTRQKRNYFWYARTFSAPARKDRATLVVQKAQFGTAVWLNGQKVGENSACFTSGRFDLTAAMNWQGENRLVIRIGAHPGAMPDWAFWGSDGEKGPWTPGIYDRVELLLADNPVIEAVQVAPKIATGEILVQTRLKNYGAARSVDLVQQVSTWKPSSPVGQPVHEAVALGAGEERVVLQTVKVPGATLWSPENPFLYVLATGTGGDGSKTRFGMRELRFDPATRRAVLNGKVCYLRGASLTLHRFFGDPKCGGLPWDEAWVRKFLVDIPKRMHWNAFRICIGPAPQQWLDVADEAGLLLEYEFPIWSDREPMRHKLWREDDIVEQLGQFVRDSWNHPSVVLWDASNETHWDFLSKRLVPAVRGLDLSGRPWENGYEEPGLPGDPYETHPYQFISYVFGKPPYFQMTDLDRVAAQKLPNDWHARHAAIINEYDWLWLHRDGRPTDLSKKVYDALLGPIASSQERLALNAYLTAGLTEFWRAQRRHAGVLYLAYLDGDLPHAFTCDNFRDVARLELDPGFEDYVEQAFKPLGVYVDFWQPSLPAGAVRTYRLALVNDTQQTARGRLTLSWEPRQGGPPIARVEKPFEVAPVGETFSELELPAPPQAGDYLLIARAFWDGQPWSPTVSRRKVSVEDPAAFSWPGEKMDTWHGYRRHNFTVDGCAAWVVEPKQAAPGNPWTWCMEFPDAFTDRTGVPQLLAKGFCDVHISVGNTHGCPAALKHFDAFYQAITARGLAKRGTLIGISRGGLYAYNWAARNPDKVVCIYGDAPVCDFKSWPGGKGKAKGSKSDWAAIIKNYGFRDEAEALAYKSNPVDELAPLAKAGIALVHVVGDADDVVPVAENTAIVERRYKQLGGTIVVIHKPGVGHHPHGLDDPEPVVKFILEQASKTR